MLRTTLTTVLLLTSLALPANAKNRKPEVHESPLVIEEFTPLDLYIERLAFLESSGRETIQRIDSNGKWSRGCLQFQDATWKEQSDKHGISGSPLNCATAKHLAKAMLSDNPKNTRHWFNATRKLGVPPLQ